MIVNFRFIFSFIFFAFASITFLFSQSQDSIFANQIYFKLNCLEDLSKQSWKIIDDNPSNVPLSVFTFKNYLDSLGISNIEQPFGKEKKAVKLYLTFLVEFKNYNQDLVKIIKKLQTLSNIDYAELVYRDHKDFIPNDPSYSSCWHLPKIQADLSWDLGKGNSDVVVSIVDDAITINHPDLKDVIWVNPDEIPNNGIDDDNNGYIDDINGWDTYTNDNDPSPFSNTNAWAHGTHCAGIAGAHTDNGIGISSVGCGISIMAVKTADNNGLVNQTWDGVYYSILAGADIISCSWSSGSYSQTNYNIIEFGINSGSIIVAAAGNNGANLSSNPKYPACYNGVICVANTTQSDTKASSSNYGTRIDISAPGSSIISTIPYNGYDYKTGTSMSAPMVAGLLGLMKSYSPNATNEQLVNCMKSSCNDIDPVNTSYIGLLGAGRINAYQALLCLSPPSANFMLNYQDSCSGEVQFTDATFGSPTSWRWDINGDGIIDDTTSTGIMYFNQSGSYNTSLTVSNDFGTDTKTIQNAINISLTEAPSIETSYVCIGDSVILGKNENLIYNWYNNENDLEIFYSGSQLTTNKLFNDTSFYISTLSDTFCYATGLTSFPTNGNISSSYSYLAFDVYKKMTLKSVDVRAGGSQDRIIVILDSINNIIFEKTITNIISGINTLDLSVELFPGNNYKIGISTNSVVNLFRANSGANFPHTIPGILSINNSLIALNNPTTQQYYYFFNWEVCEPQCESRRSEVKIITDDCKNINNLDDLILFPNPNQGSFTLRIPKNKSGKLKIINMLGQTLQEAKFSAIVEKVFVDATDLSKGVYNLWIEIDGNTVVKKFIVTGK